MPSKAIGTTSSELDQVHPGVVVVDDPAGLLDDGPADLLDRAGPAQPRRGGLEHAQLGGPRLGLLEELGVGQRDGRVRRERRDEGDVAARPVARLVGDGGQRPDDPVVVDERRDEVAARTRGRRVAVEAVRVDLADVGEREDATGPQDLPDPALVAGEDRQAGRHRRR